MMLIAVLFCLIPTISSGICLCLGYKPSDVFQIMGIAADTVWPVMTALGLLVAYRLGCAANQKSVKATDSANLTKGQ